MSGWPSNYGVSQKRNPKKLIQLRICALSPLIQTVVSAFSHLPWVLPLGIVSGRGLKLLQFGRLQETRQRHFPSGCYLSVAQSMWNVIAKDTAKKIKIHLPLSFGKVLKCVAVITFLAVISYTKRRWQPAVRLCRWQRQRLLHGLWFLTSETSREAVSTASRQPSVSCEEECISVFKENWIKMKDAKAVNLVKTEVAREWLHFCRWKANAKEICVPTVIIVLCEVKRRGLCCSTGACAEEEPAGLGSAGSTGSGSSTFKEGPGFYLVPWKHSALYVGEQGPGMILLSLTFCFAAGLCTLYARGLCNSNIQPPEKLPAFSPTKHETPLWASEEHLLNI